MIPRTRRRSNNSYPHLNTKIFIPLKYILAMIPISHILKVGLIFQVINFWWNWMHFSSPLDIHPDSPLWLSADQIWFSLEIVIKLDFAKGFYYIYVIFSVSLAGMYLASVSYTEDHKQFCLPSRLNLGLDKESHSK